MGLDGDAGSTRSVERAGASLMCEIVGGIAEGVVGGVAGGVGGGSAGDWWVGLRELDGRDWATLAQREH